MHEFWAFHHSEESAVTEPLGVLSPRIIAIFPLFQTAITMKTSHFVRHTCNILCTKNVRVATAVLYSAFVRLFYAVTNSRSIHNAYQCNRSQHRLNRQVIDYEMAAIPCRISGVLQQSRTWGFSGSDGSKSPRTSEHLAQLKLKIYLE